MPYSRLAEAKQISILFQSYSKVKGSLLAQMVKCLSAVQETWVRSLGWEGPLEKEIATTFSILVWEIPWTEEPSGLWSMGSQKSWTQLSN